MIGYQEDDKEYRRRTNNFCVAYKKQLRRSERLAIIVNKNSLNHIFFLVSFFWLSACISKPKADEYFKIAQEKEDTVAIEYYTKAIEINPKYADAYFFRGKEKAKFGNSLGALNDYNKAFELNCTDSDFYRFRGYAKVDVKDDSGALADFIQFIKINPKHELGYGNSAPVRARLKDFKGAISDYTKAIELTSEDNSDIIAMDYVERGDAKDSLKDYDGALADYNRAIEIDNEQSEAYFSRGNLKNKLSAYYEAMSDYTKAITLEKDKKYYLNRGKLKLFLGDKRGACLDLSQSGELGEGEAYDLIKEHCK